VSECVIFKKTIEVNQFGQRFLKKKNKAAQQEENLTSKLMDKNQLNRKENGNPEMRDCFSALFLSCLPEF